MAAAIVVAGLCGLGLARLGAAEVRRAQARTAADAAALAGAAEGRGSAAEVATANHAVLQRFTIVGSDVLVTVRVGDETADARARAGLHAKAP